MRAEAPAADRVFRVSSAFLFLASAWGTIAWCGSMSGGMAMPGGWTMSMAWMRMPGQTWPGAAAAFLGMWVLMMVAMMLPSLAPMLERYRRAVRHSAGRRLGRLTAVAASGYFAVWAVLGTGTYVAGIALASAEMTWPPLARAVPLATGAALLLAAAVQLSPWKARQLAHCRTASPCGPDLAPDAPAAFRHGLRLGLHCGLCCSGLILALLVTGVMDLGVMAVVAAAITVERLAPRPALAARIAGALLAAAGALAIARSFAA